MRLVILLSTFCSWRDKATEVTKVGWVYAVSEWQGQNVFLHLPGRLVTWCFLDLPSNGYSYQLPLAHTLVWKNYLHLFFRQDSTQNIQLWLWMSYLKTLSLSFLICKENKHMFAEFLRRFSKIRYGGPLMPILSIRTAFIEEEGKEELGIFIVS